MRMKNEFLRPVTLEPGAACIRIEPSVHGGDARGLPVWFVGYDPCPAIVIVRTMDGNRQRCPRSEIFINSQDVYGRISQEVVLSSPQHY